MITFYVKPNSFFLKDGKFDGVNYGPITFINKNLNDKDKEAIYAHEKVHYNQWKNRPFTHLWKYDYNNEYRLGCEIEAYKIQNRISFHPQAYAKRICTQYNIDFGEKDINKVEKELTDYFYDDYMAMEKERTKYNKLKEKMEEL